MADRTNDDSDGECADAPLKLGIPTYFLATSIVTFLLVTGVNILSPILPIYASSLRLTNLEIGVIVGAYAAGRLLFDVPAGTLSDRIGVRATATIGCSLTAISSVVGGFANGLGELLVARGGQGIGSALFMTSTTGLIVRIAPHGSLGRLMALHQGIFMTGLAVGPLVGGALASAFGLNAPFFAYGFMAMACAVASAGLLPSERLQDRFEVNAGENREPSTQGHRSRASGLEASKQERRRELRVLLRTRAMRAALAGTLLVFVVRSGVRTTLLPLFAVAEFDFSETQVGSLLTVAAIGNIAILRNAGRMMDTKGRRVIARYSAFLIAIATLLFAAAAQGWMLYAIVVLLGVSTGYAAVVSPVVVGDIAEPAIRGTAIGLQRMVTDLGLMVGPLLAGAFADILGLRGAFVATAACALGIACIVLLMPETLPGRAQPEN